MMKDNNRIKDRLYAQPKAAIVNKCLTSKPKVFKKIYDKKMTDNLFGSLKQNKPLIIVDSLSEDEQPQQAGFYIC